MDTQGYLESVRLLPKSGCAAAEAGGPQASRSGDAHQVSIGLVCLALCFMYSVQNLIAPNMTALAKAFNFNNVERDTYIGGELTMFFYFPGVLGSLMAGVLSGVCDRRLLLSLLALLTAVACLMTARVGTFGELVWTRAITGFAIGGALPVVYSLVGDWFPPRRRASATALVTATTGAGVFVGQCVATLAGAADWRWPFLIIALPSVVTGAMLWRLAEEPIRGGQEDGVETLALYESSGARYTPSFGNRHVKFLLHNRTNHLVILQAFPGNIPWGVIIVYLHDFLVQDMGFSSKNALGAIATLAGSAFFGVLTGGAVGEALHEHGTRYLAVFAGMCNIVRAVPFFLLFGWTRYFGPLSHSSEGPFFFTLMVGGFVATMASPITGAMLLNVNLPETRGSVIAMYSVLDDLSKGSGTLFISVIVRMVGGRALAYQLVLLLWVFTGIALLCTWYTYDMDEENMKRNLDEAAREALVLLSKQRAQEAIRNHAKAAGQAHHALQQSKVVMRGKVSSDLRWPKALLQASGVTCYDYLTCNPSANHADAQEPKPPAVRRDDLRRAVRAAAEAAASHRH